MPGGSTGLAADHTRQGQFLFAQDVRDTGSIQHDEAIRAGELGCQLSGKRVTNVVTLEGCHFTRRVKTVDADTSLGTVTL